MTNILNFDSKNSIIFLVLYFLLEISGYNQTIQVVRYKDGSALVESKQFKKNSFGSGGYETENKSFYLTSANNIGLQNALKKGLEWADLNVEHKKEFEKEITRFKVMEKEQYYFYKEYIDEFAEETKVIFYGKADGTFKLVVDVPYDVGDTFDFTTKKKINDFISILQGKSVNEDIDGIFK